MQLSRDLLLDGESDGESDGEEQCEAARAYKYEKASVAVLQTIDGLVKYEVVSNGLHLELGAKYVSTLKWMFFATTASNCTAQHQG